MEYRIRARHSVDAQRFTGGEASAEEMVRWLLKFDIEANYLPEEKPGQFLADSVEIILDNGVRLYIVRPGNYVVVDKTGKISLENARAFNLKYELVEKHA